ncbi:hypothetical protein RHMOL_Rhmol02G0230700 [Rhododendron molle]|uniref:Uncharacterized protein n=1 Tax=Rhododendron molle TaxID=49168 RepID=A0ACC0PV09_RHOML|nr:hypothetical protein RHMOL_Rhmol02G0230700 [Rhododendron molle]
MASMVDDTNAYSYLYPVQSPSKKIVFKCGFIDLYLVDFQDCPASGLHTDDHPVDRIYPWASSREIIQSELRPDMACGKTESVAIANSAKRLDGGPVVCNHRHQSKEQ